jgi:hypothetical protein
MPMIVSRRKRADRLSSVALFCMVVGLCGAVWLALKPPAPAELSRAPAASQAVSAPAPVAPAADNLSILWLGANDVSAASGRPSSPAAGLPPLASDAPPFAIRGMIGSLSGSSSVVFIQAASGVSMIRQGEVVDGWKLMGVTGNAATFAREDRAVTLSLAKREYDAGGGSAPMTAGSGPSPAPRFSPPVPTQLPPSPQVPRLEQASGPSTAAASTSVGSASAKTIEVVVPRSLVDQARANPLAAMQGVNIEQYAPNGQMQGYTIANVSPDSLAAPYVSSGDRILAVNGTPINSIGSAMNIYQQLSASGVSAVTVTMERGGQRLNVVYTIK